MYGITVDEAALSEETKPATPAEEAAPKMRGGRKKAAPVAEQPAPATVEETNIAAAIKALRMGKGLSQKAFAESIGLKTNTVSAYEQGRIKPSEAALAKIKDVYGTVDAAPAAQEKKPAKKETAPAVEEKKPTPKKPAKRGKKKEAAPAAPAAEEKKPTKRRKKTEAAPRAVIQSPMGGSITPEEIIKKTGPVDAVYIRVDENKAYWVRGEETGSVDLW